MVEKDCGWVRKGYGWKCLMASYELHANVKIYIMPR